MVSSAQVTHKIEWRQLVGMNRIRGTPDGLDFPQIDVGKRPTRKGRSRGALRPPLGKTLRLPIQNWRSNIHHLQVYGIDVESRGISLLMILRSCLPSSLISRIGGSEHVTGT